MSSIARRQVPRPCAGPSAATRRPRLRSPPSPRPRRSARCRSRPGRAVAVGSISIAISLLVSAPPRSTRMATPASDQASSIAAMIASTLVPSPPSGLPPHQASGTSSPTIWRTMSAAPSATFGECETMTMPTLPSCAALQRLRRPRAIISALERAPGSMWPIERRRGTRRGRGSPSSARSPRRASSRDRAQRRGTGLPAASAAATGYEHVEHGLLADLRLAARLRPRRSPCRSAAQIAARSGSAGSSLPSAMNSVP